jgi:uncharacterized protein HemY
LSDRARVDVRIRLVEGHWALGEYEEAQRAIERALDEDSTHPGLPRLLRRLQVAIDAGQGPEDLREVLDQLAGRLPGAQPPVVEPAWEEGEPDDASPLATATVAELFAEQGLNEKALRVAEDVLRRRPGDERARKLLSRLAPQTQAPDPRIAVLERWLSRVRRRRAEEGSHP